MAQVKGEPHGGDKTGRWGSLCHRVSEKCQVERQHVRSPWDRMGEGRRTQQLQVTGGPTVGEEQGRGGGGGARQGLRGGCGHVVGVGGQADLGFLGQVLGGEGGAMQRQ